MGNPIFVSIRQSPKNDAATGQAGTARQDERSQQGYQAERQDHLAPMIFNLTNQLQELFHPIYNC